MDIDANVVTFIKILGIVEILFIVWNTKIIDKVMIIVQVGEEQQQQQQITTQVKLNNMI